jgi:8-oxo-dGTP pyrophosphatase MutT (NUDIX family)
MRMDPQELKKVATVVLLRDDGAALLQHRDDKPGLPRAGMWAIPGGHHEPGEPSEDCARRELHEETGYLCDELHFLGDFPDTNDVTGRPYTLVVFWGRYDGRRTVECREGQDMRFLGRSEAVAYSVPGVVLQAWDMALAAAFPDGAPTG